MLSLMRDQKRFRSFIETNRSHLGLWGYGFTLTIDATRTNPPLSLSLFHCVHRNRKEVILGDDNSLSLTFNARNDGEGGAYEAELVLVVPPEADYSGIARNNEVTGAREHHAETCFLCVVSRSGTLF